MTISYRYNNLSLPLLLRELPGCKSDAYAWKGFSWRFPFNKECPVRLWQIWNYRRSKTNARNTKGIISIIRTWLLKLPALPMQKEVGIQQETCGQKSTGSNRLLPLSGIEGANSWKKPSANQIFVAINTNPEDRIILKEENTTVESTFGIVNQKRVLSSDRRHIHPDTLDNPVPLNTVSSSCRQR